MCAKGDVALTDTRLGEPAVLICVQLLPALLDGIPRVRFGTEQERRVVLALVSRTHKMGQT